MENSGAKRLKKSFRHKNLKVGLCPVVPDFRKSIDPEASPTCLSGKTIVVMNMSMAHFLPILQIQHIGLNTFQLFVLLNDPVSRSANIIPNNNMISE
jgi:hypothetical protein